MCCSDPRTIPAGQNWRLGDDTSIATGCPCLSSLHTWPKSLLNLTSFARRSVFLSERSALFTMSEDIVLGDVRRGFVSLAGEEILEHYRRELVPRSETHPKTNFTWKRDNRYLIHAIWSNLRKCSCGNGLGSYMTFERENAYWHGPIWKVNRWWHGPSWKKISEKCDHSVDHPLRSLKYVYACFLYWQNYCFLSLHKPHTLLKLRLVSKRASIASEYLIKLMLYKYFLLLNSSNDFILGPDLTLHFYTEIRQTGKPWPVKNPRSTRRRISLIAFRQNSGRCVKCFAALVSIICTCTAVPRVLHHFPCTLDNRWLSNW